ncbi:FHA domain-containing protein [Dolichospermum circinale]|uniref:FHA domain-containing protein n=2 Tax=Dolichospermum circinale TaxID=109265 RepID=UPI00232FF9B2|nr:FHA domain-containing protein [Dolichospermum circinale]MDB9456024.1 FHA domain-containing protein [Dolichospermum circinale CS-541/06]MDB9473927.1 FHA domain-containing protein [Dolichospermum circinale CS-537/11]MDB9477503.1 FHA domain-containing protein [Dolichospermum circinale CS-537/03]
MIVCPNCNHPNPDGAVQCEACYSPLPATAKCPNCGATVQSDAAFCGQCGYNLRLHAAAVTATTVAPTAAANIPVQVPPVAPDPIMELLKPDALGIANTANPPVSVNIPPIAPPPVASSEAVYVPPIAPEPEVYIPPVLTPAPVAVVQEQAVYIPAVPAPVAPEPEVYIPPVLTPPPAPVAPEPEAYIPPPYVPQIDPPTIPEVTPAAPPAKVSNTQLQQVVARLFHVQANQEIELPQNLSVIHIGKPNDRIPPDIDVSGFANSEIVSRIHADIRIEGDACYIEDAGSSNGTYINNLPLLPGNRHRLRPGDRISLGKGDLVTFLFQLS